MNRVSGPSRYFAQFMFCAFLVAAIYASLWPFTGWTTTPRHPLAYLGGPLWSGLRKWDAVLNFAGYFPLGFFAALVLIERQKRVVTVVVTIAILAGFSLTMEALQTYLPRRTPSLGDLVVNTLGAIAGAISGLAAAPWVARQGGVRGIRDRLFALGARSDLALVLVGVWFFALLAPRTILFGNGDIRPYRLATIKFGLAPELFLQIEVAVCALGTVGIALLLRAISHPGARLGAVFVGVIAAGLLVRSTGFALFWGLGMTFSWATSSALIGLGIGVPVGLAALRLSPDIARWAAIMAFAGAIAAINLTPPNPQLWLKLRGVRASELSSLSQITRNTAMLWPFAAIALLFLPRRGLAQPIVS
ncbi:MAG: VanZ family protein [Burkholderiales bacterium]